MDWGQIPHVFSCGTCSRVEHVLVWNMFSCGTCSSVENVLVAHENIVHLSLLQASLSCCWQVRLSVERLLLAGSTLSRVSSLARDSLERERDLRERLSCREKESLSCKREREREKLSCKRSLSIPVFSCKRVSLLRETRRCSLARESISIPKSTSSCVAVRVLQEKTGIERLQRRERLYCREKESLSCKRERERERLSCREMESIYSVLYIQCVAYTVCCIPSVLCM